MEKMEDVARTCYNAFLRRDKEMVLRILPIVSSPGGIVGYNDNTLLHRAACNGWDDICLLLMETYGCPPITLDSVGQSPLHCACSAGHSSVIALFLSKTSLRLTDKDVDGITPFHYLSKHPSAMLQLASVVNWDIEFPVSPLFKIFMTGNSAAGKSSLTAVMEELANPTHSKHGLVTGVKPLTAGVHTAKCQG